MVLSNPGNQYIAQEPVSMTPTVELLAGVGPLEG